MPKFEHIRQTISGTLTPEQLQEYRDQGWTLVALEWERETPTAEQEQLAVEVPFGLQVAAGTAALEENPAENETLADMLELMIDEGPYWRIAEELNRRGHRTRRGSKWGPVSVFEMLPRLIEAAPRIFATTDWQRRRQGQPKAV
jgi:hypothetical protein